MGSDEEKSDYIWLLHIRYCSMKKRVEAFENGHAYQILLKYVDHVTRVKDAEIKAAKKEAASLSNEIVSSRRAWNQIFDDLDKEHQRNAEKLLKQISDLEERALQAEKQRDEAKDREKEWRKKYYDLAEENENLRGLNKKLTAQVNKDFQNSSIPSSLQGLGRKKIPNSRKDTGRKPGGQPGHEGHRLLQQTPDEIHTLPDPEEYADNPDYRATDNFIKRQRIFLGISLKVVQYQAREFRNIKTGSKVHAPFPEGYDTDISYDGSVKAAMFLMNNECNVSIGKTKRYWEELTNGRLSMSSGKINTLVQEFSEKSDSEKQEIYEKLMRSPVLNADFTNANVNGESKQVLIIASPSEDVAMFYGRDHKGHKGIEGSPLVQYVGTLVHDHDTTFYSYGMAHQECAQHTGRYLIGSEENEPEYKWNHKMHRLFQKMLHYRNTLGDEPIDKKIVKEFEAEYDIILKLAEEEYRDDPPSDYYREGYNLYRRLVDFKENELLFLHDKNVPPDNSLAERLARVYKRKQKQAIVFRGDKSFLFTCEDLGVLYSLRNHTENMYADVSGIFQRKRPQKKKAQV